MSAGKPHAPSRLRPLHQIPQTALHHSFAGRSPYGHTSSGFRMILSRTNTVPYTRTRAQARMSLCILHPLQGLRYNCYPVWTHLSQRCCNPSSLLRGLLTSRWHPPFDSALGASRGHFAWTPSSMPSRTPLRFRGRGHPGIGGRRIPQSSSKPYWHPWALAASSN